MINKSPKILILLLLICIPALAQPSAEKGSKIAKDGFANETVIRDKFNNWQTDVEAKIWLNKIGFELRNIESVEAFKPHGEKADVRVKVKTKTGEFTEGISIKLVSNPKGFNQIDKRWVADYAKMWEMPADVAEALRYFVGEKLPFKESRNSDRMYLNEFDKETQSKIVKFFSDNKRKIVSDLLKGRGNVSANWFLVAQKSEAESRWTLEHIENVIDFYAAGDVEITSRGSLKIGAITMQRKGGDGGRETAKMLQFKLNPAMLFDAK
ncbi:MAG: type II restriction endonuclease [Aridibacter sp.]